MSLPRRLPYAPMRCACVDDIPRTESVYRRYAIVEEGMLNEAGMKLHATGTLPLAGSRKRNQ